MILLTLLTLSACSSGGPAVTATPGTAPTASAPAPKGATIRVDGSSTVFPITEAVAEEYRKGGNTTDVTVGIAGTGGGFKKFCAGETDLSDASRPIKPSEVELCAKNGIGYVELPVAYDGLAVVVNPGNDWVSSITTAELKKMWEPEAQGKVATWKDVNPAWPDTRLELFGPGVDSGTYDYFTDAINKKEHASRGDFTSSEDDNVLVQGVAGGKGALGFFGLAYYEENRDKLKLLPVDDGNAANGAGPIAPSAQTVQDATYQPLARPLFVYVSANALDRPEIQAFVTYYLAHASALAKEVGYIALPADAYTKAKVRFDGRKLGTVFGGTGSKVDVTLETLLGEPVLPVVATQPAPSVATDAAPPR
jgi:phosphate transport system substrate-binding protein